jgi:UDP-N-acetylmuramoyl-tripeptide--D-alanyl-D-alanine ligase
LHTSTRPIASVALSGTSSVGNFDDPFTGYTALLRIIIFGLVPLFAVLQVVRVHRALHVFQLEGYKHRRFLNWCWAHRRRALWMTASTAKKPLVMTGRAWRLLVVAVALSLGLVLIASSIAHIALGGWPLDVITWALATGLVFFFTSHLLVGADVLLTPAQAVINNRFLRTARSRLRDVAPTVVGITGSYGKTSTKFAIERLSGPPGTVLATPASFNTPLGVARTINERLQPDHRVFVVEMGAYGEGEIAELCRFVQPTIGVLTAIGPAHLERFGSLEAIRRGKYEIIQSLPTNGVAVMNIDDVEVRALADATGRVPVVRYGLDPAGRPDISATEVGVTPAGSTFTVTDRRGGARMTAHTRLLGRHAIGHVLAGVAVSLTLGRRLAELAEPIAGLEPVEHRLQLIEGTGGVTVIDDAYNSNPSGAAAALDVLESMPGRAKVVVSPGMVELGDLQFEANERFGHRAAQVADVLIVVAELNRRAITAGAARANGAAKVITVDSLADATRELRDLLGPGDVVLFENDLPDQYET